MDQQRRLRDLGIHIGRYECGRFNAITDVPGVLVGHKTVIRDEPYIVRTGVTVILPRGGRIHDEPAFAGFFSFNGIGEMTGLPVIEEWGLLTSPVVLTNTNQVGMARDALGRYAARNKYSGFTYKLPVVAETYDGYLNDIDSYPLDEQDVIDALNTASSGMVEEGNVGGGTGMICYEFKGGIGTSSRVVIEQGQRYTIGALVQANHGQRNQLCVDGVPVGRKIGKDEIPGPTSPADPFSSEARIDSSSIIVVIATDAPLIPNQCKRLARRATVGLARTGGVGLNTSGDLFLAISTGNHFDYRSNDPLPLHMLPYGNMNSMIEATAEAVEEAILNALVAARTMTGYKGRKVYALPEDELRQVMLTYRYPLQPKPPR